MNKGTVKIVTDSSSDVLQLADVPFACAPLKIITDNKEYVDDVHLDVQGMVTDLAEYKGRSSTSCPNAADWLDAFGEAEEIFCVTITGTLSGSYNAAMLAKRTYEEEHPDRRVFVLNSLSTGPELGLILEKLRECVLAGWDFDRAVESITAYSQRTGLLFMLSSMRNLANNGRVSQLVAKMAGILGIRLVGKASDKGDLEPLNKSRGELKALDAIVEHLRELGLRHGRVRISHCLNKAAADTLSDRICAAFDGVQVEVTACRGLCSFYAEKGGLLIGFEKI